MFISAVVKNVSHDRLSFICPGCGFPHQVTIGQGDGPRWDWNHDYVRPTFNPSILVTGKSRAITRRILMTGLRTCTVSATALCAMVLSSIWRTARTNWPGRQSRFRVSGNNCGA